MLDMSHKKKQYYLLYLSQVSIVSIATGYRLDDKGVGVRVPVWSRIYYNYYYYYNKWRFGLWIFQQQYHCCSRKRLSTTTSLVNKLYDYMLY
jgi:hypothetical protein